jgi:hypothetical protein
VSKLTIGSFLEGDDEFLRFVFHPEGNRFDPVVVEMKKDDGRYTDE